MLGICTRGMLCYERKGHADKEEIVDEFAQEVVQKIKVGSNYCCQNGIQLDTGQCGQEE